MCVDVYIYTYILLTYAHIAELLYELRFRGTVLLKLKHHWGTGFVVFCAVPSTITMLPF